MDQRPADRNADPVDASTGADIVVSGCGHVVLAAGSETRTCDPRTYLRERKHRKFMSEVDKLAVVAAGRALEDAALAPRQLGARCGLFVAVGHISFAAADLDALHDASLVNGEFSMQAYSTTGVAAVHPLLTFRCLPSMAAYHVSTNFDIQGPYLVTYPGVGQVYLALEQAIAELRSGSIDIALVGGAAHQRNVLVEHHFARVDVPIPATRLADGAGFLVLETATNVADRGGRVRGRLASMTIDYAAPDPFASGLEPTEVTVGGAELSAWGEVGPASLPAWLAESWSVDDAHSTTLEHRVTTRDGLTASSQWATPSSQGVTQ